MHVYQGIMLAIVQYQKVYFNDVATEHNTGMYPFKILHVGKLISKPIIMEYTNLMIGGTW